jgi:hypothetical protein
LRSRASESPLRHRCRRRSATRPLLLLAKQLPITRDNAQSMACPPPALTTVALLKSGKPALATAFRNPDKRISHRRERPLLSTQTAGRKQDLAGQPA